VFRIIDEIELENEGTVRDRINRAEKRGLIDEAEQFIEIRRLRNKISHDYDQAAIENIFKRTLILSSVLLKSVEKSKKFCHERY
ncbi:nucleotidyltransferase substrate binding protein, partial [Fibrobacterota bacterium]